MAKLAKAQRDRFDTPATKAEVQQIRHELDQKLASIKREQAGKGNAAIKAIRMAKRGMDNIGKSLNSPENEKRPRISQMPGRRSEIGIALPNLVSSLEFLKPVGLRGQTLKGGSSGVTFTERQGALEYASGLRRQGYSARIVTSGDRWKVRRG